MSGDDLSEVVDELVRLVQRLKLDTIRLEALLDDVEAHQADKLNQAYAQGVRDATKARTGHDPAVENDA